jgi:hypothetical protein
MPRVIPKTFPFKPGEIVTAWMAFACDVNGDSFTITRGQRLRADHPAVLACPSYFWKAEDAVAPPNLWDHVLGAPDPEPEFYKPLPPTARPSRVSSRSRCWPPGRRSCAASGFTGTTRS